MFCIIIAQIYVLTFSLPRNILECRLPSLWPILFSDQKTHYRRSRVSAEVRWPSCWGYPGREQAYGGLKLSCDVFGSELYLTPLDYMGLCPVNVQVWHRQESFLNRLLRQQLCSVILCTLICQSAAALFVVDAFSVCLLLVLMWFSMEHSY